MGSYIPSTPQQRQEMLKAIGLSSFRELYGDVPAEMYLDRPLNIPSGTSWRWAGPSAPWRTGTACTT